MSTTVIDAIVASFYNLLDGLGNGLVALIDFLSQFMVVFMVAGGFMVIYLFLKKFMKSFQTKK